MPEMDVDLPHSLQRGSHVSDDVKWIGIAHRYFYNVSFREIGRTLFRDHATVRNWWRNFKRYGQPSKCRLTTPKTLGPCELDYLRRAIEESPTVYLDELANDMLKFFGVEVSVATICRSLYHDLGLNRKRITKYNIEKSLALQRDYWEIMRQLDARADMLIFVDETSKDSRDLARLYGR